MCKAHETHEISEQGCASDIKKGSCMGSTCADLTPDHLSFKGAAML